MPNGYGTSSHGKAVPEMQAVVDRLPPPAAGGAQLANAAARAVQRLAAASGAIVTLPPLSAPSGSGASHDRLTIGIVAALLIALWAGRRVASPPPRPESRSVRGVTLLAALVGVVLACTACGSTHKTAVVEGPGPSPYGDGYLIDPPTAAPGFSLIDQTGTKLGAQDQLGHWSIVTFMYTRCPDVCPLIANTLRTAMLKLTDLRVLAVSVDPKNDTPSAVRTFLSRHRVSAKFHYLTGTRAQLAPVWAKYHVASTGGPHATISHSQLRGADRPEGTPADPVRRAHHGP